MQIPITSRRRYALGARNGLKRALALKWNGNLPASDRDPFFVFDLWWKHVPAASRSLREFWRRDPAERDGDWSNFSLVPIRQLFEYVVRCSESPPELLEHVLIAATRKGYFAFVARLVTTRLAHLYNAEQMARFLDQLSAQAIEHALWNKDDEQMDYVKTYSARLWGNAIRKQCNDHHVSDAIALLRAAAERNIQLDHFTYRYVLGVVRDDAQAVKEVISLSDEPNLAPAKVGEILGDTSVEQIPSIYDWRSIEENLDIATHHLRVRSLAPGSGVTVARALLPLFYLAYHARKPQRRLILQALHSRGHSLGVLPDVLHAHILFNIRRRKPSDALAAFRRYFHPGCVPMDIIHTRLQDTLANHRVNQLIVLPDKFEPDRQVQALAWGALVHMTRDAKSFEELYARLLSAADHVRMRDTISPEAFQHFIRPMGSRLPPHVRTHEFAQRVLRDMSERGIEPSIRVHAAAAGAYLCDGVMDGFTSHIDAMFDLCRAQLDGADTQIAQRKLREARQGGVAEVLGVAFYAKAYEEARMVVDRLDVQEQSEAALGWKPLQPPSILLDRIRDLQVAEARKQRWHGLVDTAIDATRLNAEVPGGAWLGSASDLSELEGTPVIEEPDGPEPEKLDEGAHWRRESRTSKAAHEHGGHGW
ncbi:unnamed protein product [Peniophora sp. CBMAI 1063]|nr:unnamed protein product [Peniophora sp. CBMAI 1063]